MRKQTVSLLVLLIAASGFFFSCKNIMNKNEGALEFDSVQINRTTHLLGDTANPACNLVVNLTYASQSADSQMLDSVNTCLLSLCLGNTYGHLRPAEAVEQFAEKYASDYRRDLEPTFREERSRDENEVGAWYSYYKKIEGSVQYYTADLLVYRCRYDEYTGGAHGIYNTTFLNLNLHTLMPVRLDDLFVADSREALTDLLWNQLMADHHVTSREELEEQGYTSTGELVPTENFYLSAKGITFYYNVYEIAPYVMGPVEISLPWEMVQHLRKPVE